MIPAPTSKTYKEESKLLKDVIDWLEPQIRDGIKVIRIVDRYTKGYSDLFVCAQGRFVVAELKDDEGVATPHQEEFIRDIERAQGVGGVCRTVKDVSDLIDQALYCHCGGLAYVAFCPFCGRQSKGGLNDARNR